MKMDSRSKIGLNLQMAASAALSSKTSTIQVFQCQSLPSLNITHLSKSFDTTLFSDHRYRDSGIAAIESLMERRGAFDYILCETTGLADPGNIAPLFWMDDGLGSSIYLDGVVTLVDAKHILKSLDEGVNLNAHLSSVSRNKLVTEQSPKGHSLEQSNNLLMTTAHLQISHADVIVINKSDLVGADELEATCERIRSINGLAKIHITRHSRVPQLEGIVLDLHAYDTIEEIPDFAAKGHSHLDPTVSTITLKLPVMEPIHLTRLDAWLRSVCWESILPTNRSAVTVTNAGGYFEIHRIKARLRCSSGQVKLLQGVREVFEITDSTEPIVQSPGALAASKMVIIGRALVLKVWQKSLDAAMLEN